MTIEEIQEEIIEEFELFDDWMQRYEHIIESGKSLDKIDEQYKDEAHLIKGCQSQVWLQGEMEEGKLVFTADSDAILTKGIIALLLRVYSGQLPADILNKEPHFIDEIGLKEHLSPTRANGLVSMVKQLKLLALKHSVKSS